MFSRRHLMIPLVTVLAFYLLVVVLVFLFQDRLVFVGAGLGKGVPLEPRAGVRVDRLQLASGGSFRVALAEPKGPPSAVIVFFCGNMEDLQSGMIWARVWADLGAAAVVVEYPGYGDSDGTPSVASFREAADAAAAFAGDLARSAGVSLVAGGISLGSFNAVHLAASAPAGAGPARLLLLAPLTSLVEAAGRHYPWLPVRWLLRHRFDNIARAADVRCPTLILHGDRDQIIPIAMGRALQAAIGPRCELVVAHGHGHNDLPVDGEGPIADRLRAFLAGK